MPEITVEELPAFAHCIDFPCPGNAQEKVIGVKETREYRAYEVGGETNVSDPMTRIVDRSMDYWSFKDEADRPCAVCGKPREISPQKRPVYPRRSGVRQDALALIQKHGSVAAGEAFEARQKAEAAEKVAKETQDALKRAKAPCDADSESASLLMFELPPPLERPAPHRSINEGVPSAALAFPRRPGRPQGGRRARAGSRVRWPRPTSEPRGRELTTPMGRRRVACDQSSGAATSERPAPWHRRGSGLRRDRHAIACLSRHRTLPRSPNRRGVLMAARLTKTRTPGVFKRGPRYAFLYRDASGRQRQESARTYEDARTLKRQREADVSRGEHHAESRLRFEDYANEWVQRHVGIKKSTRDTYKLLLRVYVLKYFGSKRLGAITTRRGELCAVAYRAADEGQQG